MNVSIISLISTKILSNLKPNDQILAKWEINWKEYKKRSHKKSYLSKMQTFSFFEYFGTQTYTYKSIYVFPNIYKQIF